MLNYVVRGKMRKAAEGPGKSSPVVGGSFPDASPGMGTVKTPPPKSVGKMMKMVVDVMVAMVATGVMTYVSAYVGAKVDAVSTYFNAVEFADDP